MSTENPAGLQTSGTDDSTNRPRTVPLGIDAAGAYHVHDREERRVHVREPDGSWRTFAVRNRPAEAFVDHVDDTRGWAERWSELPAVWLRLEGDELPHDAVAGWRHAGTGHRVLVRQQRRPTQMHTPERAVDDTGYVAEVRDPDGVGAALTHDLAGKGRALAAAVAFAIAHADGGIDVVAPGVWAEGPTGWGDD